MCCEGEKMDPWITELKDTLPNQHPLLSHHDALDSLHHTMFSSTHGKVCAQNAYIKEKVYS